MKRDEFKVPDEERLADLGQGEGNFLISELIRLYFALLDEDFRGNLC